MQNPSQIQGFNTAADPHPMQGLLVGTQVRTLDGLLPVEYLEPGDRIVTRIGTARLVSITSSLCKMALVVRIAASTLGHDRPATDLILGPGQRVVIRDWRARVLYGTSAAAIPASRLVDGEFVRHDVLPVAHLYTLRFAALHVIYAEGLELACPKLASAPV